MRIRSAVAIVSLAAGLASCGRCGGPTVAVPDKPSHTVEAPSAELDPHFRSQNITMRGIDPAAWDTICRRVAEMGLKRIRVMLMPAWYEPTNDNDDPDVTDFARMTFESEEMLSLYETLDLAQSNGMDVTLVMWGCNRTLGSVIDERYRSQSTYFLAEGNDNDDWCVPSKHTEEWCENISAALRHLIVDKGYTCIREFTLMNEPSWSYGIDGRVDRERYTEMCHAADERLRRDGLRDKVRFNLSDDAEDRDFLRHAAATVDDVAECYNSHTYRFGYDTPNSEIEAWERANTEVTAPTGKRHFIGEFGSNQTEGASRQRDIDLYERGVLMVRTALSLMNAGAAGVSYWSLTDQYYSFTDSYASMQQLGLWRSAKSEYASEPYAESIRCDLEPRPQYYAYSLLTRHIPRSEIYPLRTGDDFVAAAAFRTEKGKWIYAIANGSDRRYAARIENGALETAVFGRYVYTRDELPKDDSPIGCGAEVKCRGGATEAEAGAQSVVLYVEK